MYFLLKLVIFQLAMLVYQRGTFVGIEEQVIIFEFFSEVDTYFLRWK